MTVSHALPRNASRLLTLIWAVLVAASAAALLNTLLFATGIVLGAFPLPVVILIASTPPPVTLVSFLGVVAGGVLLALLGRFTSKAVHVYQVIGVVFLVLSFITPLDIPNVSLSMFIVLELMHFVTGVAALWLIPWLVIRWT